MNVADEAALELARLYLAYGREAPDEPCPRLRELAEAAARNPGYFGVGPSTAGIWDMYARGAVDDDPRNRAAARKWAAAVVDYAHRMACGEKF